MKYLVSGACLLLMASQVHGQTQIDLRTQGKSFDFTAAAVTRPFKMGAALPASCAAGDTFFKTDAQPGQNLYTCSGANQWRAVGALPSLPAYVHYAAAKCQGSQASAGFNLPSSSAPTPSCINSGSTVLGGLLFTPQPGAAEFVQDHFGLPDDVAPAQNLDVRVRWRSGATTGAVTWAIQITCLGDGAAVDSPTFNNPLTVSHAPQAVASQIRTDTVSGVPLTGCSGGNELFFRFYRDNGDSMVANAELLSLQFIFRRSF